MWTLPPQNPKTPWDIPINGQLELNFKWKILRNFSPLRPILFKSLEITAVMGSVALLAGSWLTARRLQALRLRKANCKKSRVYSFILRKSPTLKLTCSMLAVFKTILFFRPSQGSRHLCSNTHSILRWLHLSHQMI